MSTLNIDFYEEISKIIPKLSPNTLICSTDIIHSKWGVLIILYATSKGKVRSMHVGLQILICTACCEY